MRICRLLLSSAVVLALVMASARAEKPGWYLGVEGGWSHLMDPSSKPTSSGSPLVRFTARMDEGFAVGGMIGYSGVFLPGIRLEGELVYRAHGLSNVSGPFQPLPATGSIESFGLMANVIYDFKNATRWTPYIGGGIGAAEVSIHDAAVPSLSHAVFSDTRSEFAYQAIGGIAYEADRNWSVSLDYRYFATLDPTFHAAISGAPLTAKTHYSTHNVMVGIAYHFAPAPAPPSAVVQPAPVPPPVPMPPTPQMFVVYFDFDKSTLTPDGANVVQQASVAFKRTGSATVAVTGHTDLVGTQLYNLELSKRRAEVVRAELMKDGVPESVIVATWRGKQSPAVPTADGVREPRNRRVEIVL